MRLSERTEHYKEYCRLLISLLKARSFLPQRVPSKLVCETITQAAPWPPRDWGTHLICNPEPKIDVLLLDIRTRTRSTQHKYQLDLRGSLYA